MHATSSVGIPGGELAPSPRTRTMPDPLRGLDREVERELGADMRLLYGMLGPILVICGVIVGLVFSRSYWVVAGTVVLELAALGLIIVKLMAMLGEGEAAADDQT